MIGVGVIREPKRKALSNCRCLEKMTPGAKLKEMRKNEVKWIDDATRST
jgi:hypothetical protein